MKPREQAAASRPKARTVSLQYQPPGLAKATESTDSIDTDEVWQGTIFMSPLYRLYSIDTSQAARVRLYTDADSRTADLFRAVGTDPADGAGLVFEFVSEAPDLLAASLSPNVDGSSASGFIPMSVTNLGSAGVVRVTFTFLPVGV